MPERPSYNLGAIERKRDQLRTELGAQFGQQVLQADLFNAFVVQVRQRLPATVSYDAAYESCRGLLGRAFTPAEALNFCWRLAGNMDRLREGLAVGPWAGQRGDEWVPLQIIRGYQTRNAKRKLGTEFTFRILAGSPAGMRTTAFWSKGLTSLVAGNVGFSRFGDYRFRNHRDLVGLRLYGLVEAKRSATSPSFFEMAYPQSLVTWNRENVLRIRCRKEPCPRGWLHPCHRCAVGFTECPAAVHRFTYERGHCHKCQTPDALFDPEDQTGACVVCTHRERMKTN